MTSSPATVSGASGPHPALRVEALPSIPEQLPGEPYSAPLRAAALVRKCMLHAAIVLIFFVVLLPLWLPFLLLLPIYGWPPNVPLPSQLARYLGRCWTELIPAPGRSLGERCFITLLILRRVTTMPLWGTAWFVDEVLYGRRLRAIEVRMPLVEISAARSGSTQLARYLEEDPAMTSPSLLQCLLPYLWLWKLAAIIPGRDRHKEKIRHHFEHAFPQEFIERHEGDPFRTDTFEGCFYLFQMMYLCPFLGPELFNQDFASGRLGSENKHLWEEIFVALFDGIGRRCLLFAGPSPDGRPRRLFIKGHFLAAAPALARRYPDARFLTVIRVPDKRLQSAVNFLRANPFDKTVGPVPWSWLASALVRTESDYCENELEWFTAPEGPRRCIVRFEDYVQDLHGTMERIYSECMEGPVPEHVPRTHPPRRRAQYLLDRTLEQVGIDGAALNAHLSRYVEWCRGIRSP